MLVQLLFQSPAETRMGMVSQKNRRYKDSDKSDEPRNYPCWFLGSEGGVIELNEKEGHSPNSLSISSGRDTPVELELLDKDQSTNFGFAILPSINRVIMIAGVAQW